MERTKRRTVRSLTRITLLGVVILSLTACVGRIVEPDPAQEPVRLQPSQNFPVIHLPQGFRIEKVVDGLTYATGLTFDDQGRLHVAEAGGMFLERPNPPRILRIEDGRAVEVVNLQGRVGASVVGLTWHNGAFYISHRDSNDRTGAVSRVTPDGSVTQILSGIRDSRAEHFLNDLAVGPDGRMYLASGPAGNAAVVGIDLAPFVEKNPDLHTTPCKEIVLTGVNFGTPDFRTDDPSDVVYTGAFVPFGTRTQPGQRIAGNDKCGGAILAFDPNNAEGTIRPFAHGFRNVVGITWSRTGEMFVTQNGYDIRGSRPFNDRFDPTYRVREGTWYGYPDFSAAFEPITNPEFDVPNSLKAPRAVGEQDIGKEQRLVIDHAASGLSRPDRSLVLGLHEVNSSPSGIDVAPTNWGNFSDHVFVAEWGDLTPPTNPLRNEPTGSRISRIDPRTGDVSVIIRNQKRGPASAQDAEGQGLERPFDLIFGPDGAMYISDYGIARINPAREGTPYEVPPNTGAIWKITPTGT
jgi:glucose/arabinose dehydrogenase